MYSSYVDNNGYDPKPHPDPLLPSHPPDIYPPDVYMHAWAMRQATWTPQKKHPTTALALRFLLVMALLSLFPGTGGEGDGAAFLLASGGAAIAGRERKFGVL